MSEHNPHGRRVDLSTVLPPIDLGKVSEEVRALVAQYPEIDPLGRRSVFATRTQARKVAGALPAGLVTLDCSNVAVVSPPFVDELLHFRPDVMWDAMNEDVAESVALVVERQR